MSGTPPKQSERWVSSSGTCLTGQPCDYSTITVQSHISEDVNLTLRLAAQWGEQPCLSLTGETVQERTGPQKVRASRAMTGTNVEKSEDS